MSLLLWTLQYRHYAIEVVLTQIMIIGNLLYYYTYVINTRIFQGYAGAQGPVGPPGQNGEQGDMGEPGLMGPSGEQVGLTTCFKAHVPTYHRLCNLFQV